MTAVLESPTNTPGAADAYIATSVDLLRTIAEVLDVRTIFPRLSEIANRIVPHDALAMGFVGGDGQLVIEAATADVDDLPAACAGDAVPRGPHRRRPDGPPHERGAPARGAWVPVAADHHHADRRPGAGLGILVEAP